VPWYHWLMPISCHFQDCKVLLHTNLTHVTLRSHRRQFVPDCESFKIVTKSQFILEANRQPKSIGEKISACRNFFADFAETPDLIRNRHLSVFISVCPTVCPVYPSLSGEPDRRLSVTKIALLTSILFPNRHR